MMIATRTSQVLDLVPEGRNVLLLDRVEEPAVPVVQKLRHVDDEDVEAEDEEKDAAAEPSLADREGRAEDPERHLLRGEPVGLGERPELGKEAARGGKPEKKGVDHRQSPGKSDAFFPLCRLEPMNLW